MMRKRVTKRRSDEVTKAGSDAATQVVNWRRRLRRRLRWAGWNPAAIEQFLHWNMNLAALCAQRQDLRPRHCEQALGLQTTGLLKLRAER